MTLRDFLDEAGLMPQVGGIAGPMDGRRRDGLVSRMPASKIETRLQGALQEPLYPLAVLGDVALSFTYPSGVFLMMRRTLTTHHLGGSIETIRRKDSLAGNAQLNRRNPR